MTNLLVSPFIRTSLSVGSFLILWEIVGQAELVPTSLFPPPSQVMDAFSEMAETGELMRDVKASVWRALLGFFLGSLVAILTGLVTGRIQVIDHYLTPLIELFRPLPPVAMIPLIIIWFGVGELSKLFSIAFAVFFPVWVNTHTGAREIAKTFLWGAHSLNVRGASLLWKVIFPGALQNISPGLKTGVSIAFIMVFVTELAGASAGIGYQISTAHLNYRVDRMVAALILLGMIGAATNIFLVKIMSIIFPWLKFIGQK